MFQNLLLDSVSAELAICQIGYKEFCLNEPWSRLTAYHCNFLYRGAEQNDEPLPYPFLRRYL